LKAKEFEIALVQQTSLPRSGSAQAKYTVYCSGRRQEGPAPHCVGLTISNNLDEFIKTALGVVKKMLTDGRLVKLRGTGEPYITIKTSSRSSSHSISSLCPRSDFHQIFRSLPEDLLNLFDEVRKVDQLFPLTNCFNQ